MHEMFSRGPGHFKGVGNNTNASVESCAVGGGGVSQDVLVCYDSGLGDGFPQ